MEPGWIKRLFKPLKTNPEPTSSSLHRPRLVLHLFSSGETCVSPHTVPALNQVGPCTCTTFDKYSGAHISVPLLIQTGLLQAPDNCLLAHIAFCELNSAGSFTGSMTQPLYWAQVSLPGLTQAGPCLSQVPANPPEPTVLSLH